MKAARPTFGTSEAQLPVRASHDLRHTAATSCLSGVRHMQLSPRFLVGLLVPQSEWPNGMDTFGLKCNDKPWRQSQR
jgi:hypothetical protein